MNWRKLGHFFLPPPVHPWLSSHCAHPRVFFPQGPDRGPLRLFFTSRDAQNRSFIAWAELSFPDGKLLELGEVPVLAPGPPGGMDQDGVTLGSMHIEADGAARLYYLGWHVLPDGAFHNSVGLAVGNAIDGKSFTRFSPDPLPGLSVQNGLSLSYPTVLKAADRWQLWLGRHSRYLRERADWEHLLYYAESPDGIHWQLQDNALIAPNVEDYAFSRPSVIYEAGKYHLWYSWRGAAYRIAYATSPEPGGPFQPLAAPCLSPEPNSWEGGMVCYPHVFDFQGKRYMLYSGGRFGSAGLGLAVAE